MKSKTLFAVLFFLSLAASSFAQTADEIISDNIKAMGGKEKISGIKTLKMTGNMDVGPDMKAPFTIHYKDGKKSRFELELQGMKWIQVLEGDSGWSINQFSGKTDPERMSQEEVKIGKDQADITGALFNYKTKGHSVEYLGKEDMEGTETYKLKVNKKNGNVTYIYLDATTHLQLKETTKHKSQDKETEVVSLNSNYKSVDGIMFPFSWEQRASDEASQGQVFNIVTIEVNPKIDDSIFKMPAMTSATEKSIEKEVKK